MAIIDLTIQYSLTSHIVIKNSNSKSLHDFLLKTHTHTNTHLSQKDTICLAKIHYHLKKKTFFLYFYYFSKSTVHFKPPLTLELM